MVELVVEVLVVDVVEVLVVVVLVVVVVEVLVVVVLVVVVLVVVVVKVLVVEVLVVVVVVVVARVHCRRALGPSFGQPFWISLEKALLKASWKASSSFANLCTSARASGFSSNAQSAARL